MHEGNDFWMDKPFINGQVHSINKLYYLSISERPYRYSKTLVRIQKLETGKRNDLRTNTAIIDQGSTIIKGIKEKSHDWMVHENVHFIVS